MFVKQIDLKEALRLAHKDQEVKILVPSPDGDWEDMYPTTLQSMLDGCLFFRQEPAMEKSEFDGVFQATKARISLPSMPAEQSPPPSR